MLTTVYMSNFLSTRWILTAVLHGGSSHESSPLVLKKEYGKTLQTDSNLSICGGVSKLIVSNCMNKRSAISKEYSPRS